MSIGWTQREGQAPCAGGGGESAVCPWRVLGLGVLSPEAEHHLACACWADAAQAESWREDQSTPCCPPPWLYLGTRAAGGQWGGPRVTGQGQHLSVLVMSG